MVTHTVRGGASLRVACARERFSQSQWTGATSLLPAERIEEGMRAEGITPYRCLYTPLYQKLASELTVREVRVAVKGFWVKMLVAVTTLLGFRRGAKYICSIPLYVLIPNAIHLRNMAINRYLCNACCTHYCERNHRRTDVSHVVNPLIACKKLRFGHK